MLDWEIFQAILGKFRGNSDWDWGRISAPNRVQNKTLICYILGHELFVRNNNFFHIFANKWNNSTTFIKFFQFYYIFKITYFETARSDN